MNGDAAEYRRCPLTGRRVILAPERSGRPMTLAHAEPHHRAPRDEDGRAVCPFCAGMEADTPDEVYAVRDPGGPPNGPGWRLRVVPNKFPAVRPTLDFGAESAGRQPGFGAHELIIETARHVTTPTELTAEEFAAVLLAYRERLRALGADGRVRSVTVFKNVGPEAGASLAHGHSQVVALPFVPDALARELDYAARHHAETGRVLLLDRLALDRAEGRLVCECEGFAVVTPFAPRFAYEMTVVPKRPSPRYDPTEGDAHKLAETLRRALTALDRVLDRPAYNWLLHTSPPGPDAPGFQWHFEVIPRTARPAGFEWATACHINATRPETAAAALRAALG